MDLKIYADLLSQPCRALVLFCRVAKIPHELIIKKLLDGEHLKEDMVKINPFAIVRIFELL